MECYGKEVSITKSLGSHRNNITINISCTYPRLLQKIALLCKTILTGPERDLLYLLKGMMDMMGRLPNYI